MSLARPSFFSSAARVALGLCGFAALASSVSAQPPPAVPAHTFAIGEHEFQLDGKPFLIRCGEVHFTRVPKQYWRHRLQMCRAMGLNTVCIYLFWNLHEWQEGTFNWNGPADAAEFCRLAQEEGLWVLLRPGPYSCAEWEMGGLPWWLLKRDNIKLRSSDPLFLAPAQRYLKEVGRVFAPLQITRGGPLLMVQVENEYGSFGKDPGYMGALRQALVDGGFDVPLFACNPPAAIKNGLRDDLFQVVNFGRGAEQAFKTLREFQKTGPLMNGEFYPGWFDTWGRHHRTGEIAQTVGELEYMLKNGMSFSIYMAHGGTTFGLWSGTDRPFLPDSSSYDYDAPINEAGQPTEKFTRIRELFSHHLLPGETLPPVPPSHPIVAITPFTLTETAPVLANLPAALRHERPRNIESFDHSRGCTVYRTTLPAGPGGTLTAKAAHDFAWIFLDGRPAGTMDRRTRRFRVDLPAREKPAQLDFLVESVGRVNFGAEVADRKGLLAPVEFTPRGNATPPVELTGWDVFPLPLDEHHLATLHWRPAPADAGANTSASPAFWRGNIELRQPDDTFLDLRSRGKGVVWVNGHCLGRFWNIGPTQTMYCPGPWLRAGSNEIVVLDLVDATIPTLAGLDHPILDELHPENDFSTSRRIRGPFDAGAAAPAHRGVFTDDVRWQEAAFARPVKGRYLCFEALSSIDGTPVATVAELDAFGPDRREFSKSDWRILWVDSENVAGSGSEAGNVLDGQPATFWKTEDWQQKSPYPHRLVIDLGETREIAGIRYLPRAATFAGVGHVKDFAIHVSDRPFGLTPTP